MTRTFTSNLNETAIKTETDLGDQLPEFAEPSKNVIDNILNFSKNLDVKRSKFVETIETIKS
ncbi:MAG: hypothetical protein JNJ40_17210 [Bacteroidia bacterium]|nr:hypothetical protein [Bacteroidia bacterium]